MRDRPFDLCVRGFEAGDQSAARALVLAGLGEHFGFVDDSMNPDLDDIDASYVRAGHVFLVAEAGATIVGTGALRVEGPDVGRIVRMSVRAEYRRRGVASAVLRGLVSAARARALRSVLVSTEPDWRDALGFYEAASFVPIGRDAVDVHLELRLT